MQKGVWTVIATIILLIITISLVGLLAAFLFGFFSGQTNILAMDSATFQSCVSGQITVYLRNEGNNQIDTLNITLSGTNAQNGNLVPSITGSNKCDPYAPLCSSTVTTNCHNLIPAHTSFTCSNKLTSATSGNNNVIVQLYTGNSVPASVFCS